jgi:hypothetical protein
MLDSSASQEQQPIKTTLPKNLQEQTATENVTDRLLRPIEINQQLEGKYSLFESMLKVSATTINERKGNLNEWFVAHINNYFKNEPKFQGITTEDIGSLTLVTEDLTLKKFREIYGYNYRRPVFFLSLKDYQTICRKLRGNIGSNGMVFSGGNLDNDPITKGLNIIVAGSGITDTVKHEIKHTLDPQLTEKRRHGKDEVLEEFAAYWGDVIIPRVLTQTTKHYSGDILIKEETKTNEVIATLKYMQSNLENDIYLEQYRHVFGNKKDYMDTINEVTGYIQKLQGKYDKFQIDRMLMNAVKIDDLKGCVKEQGL